MMQAAVRIPSSPVRRAAAVLLGVVMAGGTFVGASLADNRGGQMTVKMLRQIGVMEKIVDKVLLDSPNFLVRIDDNTRGLYIQEYGVVFTLDASLTGGMIPNMSKLMGNLRDLSSRFEVKTDKDGNQTIVIKKDGKESRAKAKLKEKFAGADSTDEEGDSEAPEPPSPPEPTLPPTPENWAINSQIGSKNAAELYAAGKDELIQALLDYGDTLTSLRSGQHVMIAAFLRDNDYFKENKISRLVIKAGIDDLRAYGEGKLSEKDARSRIDIEEY